MVISDTELIRRIIALAPIASKDETRFHLNTVILEKDRDMFYIYCTDGHRLVKETYEKNEDSYWFPKMNDKEKLFFRHDMIPMLKQVLKSWGKHNLVEITAARTDTGMTFTFNGQATLTLANEDSQGKYPNIDQLIPKSDKGYVTIGFNAKYMLELNKALRESNKDEVVKISFKLEKDKHGNETTLSPMFVHTKNNPNKAILMPCRIQ